MTTDIRQVSVRISEELYRRVRIKAIETGKTVSEIIREKLEEWVEDPSPSEDKER